MKKKEIHRIKLHVYKVIIRKQRKRDKCHGNEKDRFNVIKKETIRKELHQKGYEKQSY